MASATFSSGAGSELQVIDHIDGTGLSLIDSTGEITVSAITNTFPAETLVSSLASTLKRIEFQLYNPTDVAAPAGNAIVITEGTSNPSMATGNIIGTIGAGFDDRNIQGSFSCNVSSGTELRIFSNVTYGSGWKLVIRLLG